MNGGINTYGYVHGNPVNWIDPKGLSTCTDASTVAGSVIGGGIGYYGGGALGLLGGGAAGTLVAPGPGTVIGAGGGAVAGSTAGGAGGAIVGGVVGRAIGNIVCSDSGDDNVVPLFPPIPDTSTDQPEECPDDRECEIQRKSLVASGTFIMLLYSNSSTIQDVVAAQKAIQKHNTRVSAHNIKCPNHKAVPLPPILF